MVSTLFILQIILAVVLTIVILLQKSSSIGLGAYSGSNETVFGAKGPQAFLAKVTFTIGTIFILNTIALGYFYNQDHNKSVIDTIDEKALVPSAPEENSAPIQESIDAPMTKEDARSSITEAPVTSASSSEEAAVVPAVEANATTTKEPSAPAAPALKESTVEEPAVESNETATKS
jgi:preprotein translocase subunit SecG